MLVKSQLHALMTNDNFTPKTPLHPSRNVSPDDYLKDFDEAPSPRRPIKKSSKFFKQSVKDKFIKGSTANFKFNVSHSHYSLEAVHA